MKYLFLWTRIFRDFLADKTRITVSQDEVSISCRDLAQRIRQNYEPNLIIAIDAGGSIPGELIATTLGVPIVHLVVRRNINIPRRYSRDPIPWRWIMSIYHHYLFQTVRPTITVNIDINLSGQKVLIVDDSLHTGATVDVTIAYLRRMHVSEIKIASLSYTSERKPDFSALPPGNYSFPWSKDHRDDES
jgi:hypoxanthine phosphoribosyltransferase